MAKAADLQPISRAWALAATGVTITGSFEPGNRRITAIAPSEVTLSVALFPGQANDSTIWIDANAN